MAAKVQCSVRGCKRPHAARGYCFGHWRRWRRHGDVLAHIPIGSLRTPRPPSKEPSIGYTDKTGYRRIVVEGERVYEHRYVMEQMLGRPLLPGETVHHKNGRRDDNKPKNLELRLATRHAMGSTVAEALAWAREIIERYG